MQNNSESLSVICISLMIITINAQDLNSQQVIRSPTKVRVWVWVRLTSAIF